MLRFDVIGSAFAISIFLLLYYILVGFAVVYFATVFGYSEARANSLANWYWITNALALVVAGVLSDRFRVRKPFMVVGAVIGLVGIGLFALSTTHPHTGYYTLAVYFILASGGGGIAYVAWMASFTETVERHNPAATATGLAVWGWIIRIVITASLAFLTLVVPATSTLVDQGTRVGAIAAAHPRAVAVLSALDPATSKALSANPSNPKLLSTALGEVARQQGASPAVASQVSAAVLRRQSEIATAGAVDPATLGTLAATPTNGPAVGKALSEIAARFHIAPRAALQRLLALAPAPVKADLGLVSTYGAVLTSANQAIPPADLALPRRARHPGREGAEGQPAPVAALVVDLLRRPDPVPAVHLRHGRTVEPAAGPRRRA